jgi:hypothetical protein
MIVSLLERCFEVCMYTRKTFMRGLFSRPAADKSCFAIFGNKA